MDDILEAVRDEEAIAEADDISEPDSDGDDSQSSCAESLDDDGI